MEVGDQKTDVIPLGKEDSGEKGEKKQERISILGALRWPCPLRPLSHMLPAACDPIPSYMPFRQQPTCFGGVCMLDPRNQQLDQLNPVENFVSIRHLWQTICGTDSCIQNESRESEGTGNLVKEESHQTKGTSSPERSEDAVGEGWD